MPKEDIKIYLHDGCLIQIRKWFPESGGLILSINGKDTAAGNDEDSRRYLMERVLKAVRDSAYRLMHPEEGED